MDLGASELILNADHSIYHLNLRPEDLAETIITVGDPERVEKVSRHFDTVELRKGKREFQTHTGTLNGKRLTVISTGIGTDNIDIVLNELDALANIDFATRTPKKNRIRLHIVRLGTSGALRPEIPLDSLLISEKAIGLDGLMHFYDSAAIQDINLARALADHLQWKMPLPYATSCHDTWKQVFTDNRIRFGITVTAPGFYAPQGRSLFTRPKDPGFLDKLATFAHNGQHLTNMEMETAGIYGLAALMGHAAVSLNCILANRATGKFSSTPEKTMEQAIRFLLDRLTTSHTV